MFVRARRAALALAALALVTAGCGSGGGSKPAALPSISTSPSASASPTPSTPANSKAAVEAVVRRYYALLNAKTSLAQAAAIEAITDRKCTCRRPARAIRDAVAKQQHFFGVNRVVHVTPTVDGPAVADAIVEYDYTRGGIKNSQGAIVSSEPGRAGAVERIALGLQHGAWVIENITELAAGKPA